jgi:hypothetical protein
VLGPNDINIGSQVRLLKIITRLRLPIGHKRKYLEQHFLEEDVRGDTRRLPRPVKSLALTHSDSESL